ncbi:hypothetical protein VTP01DRAFT_5683 [Rhizomucor pusillus]|uniref:uncharacterized protein n=1 Tax=Rhizomucor pusillus TaxID=4840 RepID=UPI003742D92B
MQGKWSQHAGLPLPATTSTRHAAVRFVTNLPIGTLYLSVVVASTIVTNILIVRSEYKFTYPYTVNVIQLTVAFLFMTAVKRFFKLSTTAINHPWIAIRTIAPVSTLYVAMMIIQPKFLTHIPFTSYPLYYALSIPMSALYCYANRVWIVESSVLILSGIYLFSVWFASLAASASSFSRTGFLLGLTYAGLIAGYGIQLKRKLEQVDIWTLVFWKMVSVLPVMCIVTLVSGELSRLCTVMFLDEAGFWLQMVLTGLMGLATSFALVLLIKETSSPVYQTFAVNAKINAQCIIAAIIFRNPMSGRASLGTLLALAASLVALQKSYRPVENTHRTI